MAEHHLTCRACGTQFQYHRRKQYCSTGCYPSASKRQVFKPKKTKYREGGRYLRKEDRPEPCEGCGQVSALLKCFCSKCMADQKEIRHKAYKRKFRSRECLPPILRKSLRTKMKCQECESDFEYIRSTQLAVQGYERKYCSRKCQKRASDRNRTKIRRAVVRNQEAEKIDLTQVFDRDAWRCGLCGRKTLKSKRGTAHPKAPEMDHIVSIAEGGTHTWDNVQCSCRECNQRKGRNSFGQLHMFPMGYGGHQNV